MLNQELEDKLDLIIEQIDSCNDFDDLDIVADKHELIAHPHIGFKFGEAYLIYDQEPSAFDYFFHSASFAIENKTEWAGTGYANSIGHSFYYMLSMYRYDNDLDDTLFKMYANAYIYLSNCIITMKTEAYDSCRTRAKMIDNFKHKIGTEVIKKYYYNGDDLCKEILSFGDYLLASAGLEDHGLYEDSKKCKRAAESDRALILELPNYHNYKGLSDAALAKISLENSNYFVDNLLKAYWKGDLFISRQEWTEIEKSQSRNAGIGMWI
jgi:hypothetical protein